MSDTSDYKEMFVTEATEHLDSLNNTLLELEKEPNELEYVNVIFRQAHSLKGMAATMGYDQIKELCQNIESIFDKIRNGDSKISSELASSLFKCFDLLQKMVNDEKMEVNLESYLNELQEHLKNEKVQSKNKPQKDIENNAELDTNKLIEQYQHENSNPIKQTKSDSVDENVNKETVENTFSKQSLSKSIRVKMDDLENLVNLTGELMITKMRLEQTILTNGSEESKQILTTLSRLISDLQAHTMKVRLVPLDQIFNRFPRMVRDLSTKLGKQVEFTMETAGIEVDRSVLDIITDPLVHLLRNSIDHGIELPEKRESSGKSKTGKLSLTASRVGDKVVITIEDDGKGIDLDKVLAKAVEKNIISKEESNQLSEEDTINFLHIPGFSTSDEVTDVSGRGVGLDVVFNQVETAGGKASIKTKKGKGTVMVLLVPMTMSIIGGLVIAIGAEKYVLPLSSVSSTIRVSKEEIKTVNGKNVIMYRKNVIPLVNVAKVLKIENSNSDKEKKKLTVVIVKKDAKHYGLLVDSFERNEEFVIKKLDTIDSNSFKNSTILADGKPALILDPGIIV